MDVESDSSKLHTAKAAAIAFEFILPDVVLSISGKRESERAKAGNLASRRLAAKQRLTSVALSVDELSSVWNMDGLLPGF